MLAIFPSDLARVAILTMATFLPGSSNVAKETFPSLAEVIGPCSFAFHHAHSRSLMYWLLTHVHLLSFQLPPSASVAEYGPLLECLFSWDRTKEVLSDSRQTH